MNPELKFTLLYTAIGTGWILFSDHILIWLLNETSIDELWKYKSPKGVFYVVTNGGGLLYLLAKRCHESIQDKIGGWKPLPTRLHTIFRNLSV